jgi:alkaline phosphatase
MSISLMNKLSGKNIFNKWNIMLFFVWSIAAQTYAQNKEVKNVILLIPDGTSMSVISLSRWYKAYTESTLSDIEIQQKITTGEFPAPFNFEKNLCGMVSTHSAKGYISESAPAATEMAIGKKSMPGFLGLSADTIPFSTNMELAKNVKKKATGLVFTSEFTHATPAAFVSHCTNRNDYKTIKQQMMHSPIDVVFGGGNTAVLNEEDKLKLQKQGYTVTRNFNEAEQYKGNQIWGLFNTDTLYDGYMAFDLDNKTLQLHEPTLAEMTQTAIGILEKNENGFFLMVEGSKVDWAAHANDPVGVITEFIAFEKAVDAALDYAKKNKNTAVIICTDHGNGGFSIGNHFSDKGNNSKKIPPYVQYNYLPYKTIVDGLQQQNLTGDGIERKIELHKGFNSKDSIKSCMKSNYPDLVLSDSLLNYSYNYFNNKKNKERVLALKLGINSHVSDKAYLGWTTHGHTGEDIPLYIYHPNNYTLHGTIDNTQIALYIKEVLGIHDSGENLFKTFKLDNSMVLNGDVLTIAKNAHTFKLIINTNLCYRDGMLYKGPGLNILLNNTLYTSPSVFD